MLKVFKIISSLYTVDYLMDHQVCRERYTEVGRVRRVVALQNVYYNSFNRYQSSRPSEHYAVKAAAQSLVISLYSYIILYTCTYLLILISYYIQRTFTVTV